MIDLLTLLLTSITNFFADIWTYLTEGVYKLLVWATAWFIKHATLATLQFVTWALPFAWDVAQSIIADMQLSGMLANAWGAIDSNAAGLATLLRIPEAVNILISAAVTRYVMRFIPFM